jgi:hypothetical protein
LRVWWLTGDFVFQLVLVSIFVLVFIVLGALLYGVLNDIPLTRVIVAMVGSAVFWVFVASQLLYRFRQSHGNLTAMAFAFPLASVLAVAFGMWLINWSWLDTLF